MVFTLRWLLLFELLVLLPMAHGGILEDFEEDATRPPSKRRARDPYGGRDPFHEANREMSREQANRGQPLVVWNPLDSHEFGNPTKPLFRIDGAYQMENKGVEALDTYLQAGYESIGIDFRYTRYLEREAGDSLLVSRGHILLRSGHTLRAAQPQSFRQGFYEFDVGIGIMSMKGKKTYSGLSFTMPILFYPWRFVGMEFRPAWAYIQENLLEDYDFGVHVLYRYVGVKIGYHWFRSPNVMLHGPYAGVTLRF